MSTPKITMSMVDDASQALWESEVGEQYRLRCGYIGVDTLAQAEASNGIAVDFHSSVCRVFEAAFGLDPHSLDEMLMAAARDR